MLSLTDAEAGKSGGITLGSVDSKLLDLTDEQIDKCAYRTGMWCDGTPDSWDMEAIRNFARAILREAQGD